MVKRFEFEDGTIIYRNENGFYHREDGPALIYPSGRKEWWLNGEIHREDGPAIVHSNGKISWYLNDIKYSFKEWVQSLNISNEEKMELMLRYG